MKTKRIGKKLKEFTIVPPFNSNELKALDNFYLHHRACYILEGKTESFEIKTIATGLGNKIEIKCKCCGEKKDVSDYDNW